MSNDHTENLLKAVGIIKHSGRLIYPDKGKFYVNGNTKAKKEFNSLSEAKRYIDYGIKDFQNLIQKQYNEQQQRLREVDETNSDE